MHPGYPDPWRSWPPTPEAVRAAQNGDGSVLTTIATAAIPKLVSFYRGLGMRQHDAEDLAGDTCEALVKGLPRLRNPQTFEAWFWRVARSKFYDQLRRKQRGAPPVERDAVHEDPSEGLVMADEHADVRTAFAGLSVRDRELLWMREVAGLPYTDVAGRFSLKQGAARIAVMRARQRLAEALSELEDPRPQLKE